MCIILPCSKLSCLLFYSLIWQTPSHPLSRRPVSFSTVILFLSSGSWGKNIRSSSWERNTLSSIKLQSLSSGCIQWVATIIWNFQAPSVNVIVYTILTEYSEICGNVAYMADPSLWFVNRCCGYPLIIVAKKVMMQVLYAGKRSGENPQMVVIKVEANFRRAKF